MNANKFLFRTILGVSIIGSLSFASSINQQKKTYNVEGIKFVPLAKDSKIFKIASEAPLFKKFHTQVKTVMKMSDGLYYIQVERNGRRFDFYWDKDKNAFFNTSILLTANGKVIKVPVIIDKNLLKKSIAFTYGHNIKGELYMFTDPQCPFCKRAEKRLGKKLEKDYKVHTILFPLSFHDRALPLTQWILRAKTDKERYKRMKEAMQDNENPQIGKDLGFKHWNDRQYSQEIEKYREIVEGRISNYKPYFKSKEELKKFQRYLKNVRKLVQEANVRGTPTFLNKDYRPVNPYSL